MPTKTGRLQLIVEALVAEFNPLKIIHFGETDAQVCPCIFALIGVAPALSRAKLTQKAANILRKTGLEADIFFYSEKEFEAFAQRTKRSFAPVFSR